MAQLPWYSTNTGNLADTLSRLQTTWKSLLNPLLANQWTQGQLLTDIDLINGATTINHKLSRQMVGWTIADQNASASIYRSQPLNATTLTLTSSAAVTVNIWVF